MSQDQDSSCNDPHYMDMLESILRLEVQSLSKTEQSIQKQIKEKKELVRTRLQARMEIKEKSKNAQENIMFYTSMLRTLEANRSENLDKIEKMKNNEDDAYQIKKLEYEKYDRIIDEYKETWEAYQVKYEQLPLAKVRLEWRIHLAKQQTEKMLLQYKIAELAKMEQKMKYITWLRMREKIIEFAKAMVQNKKNQQKLDELKATVNLRDAEMKAINEELETQLKRIQEEKEKRAIDLLKMPPPKFNFSCNQPTSLYRRQMGISEALTQIYENSLDSMSIDSLMLEDLNEEDDEPKPKSSFKRAGCASISMHANHPAIDWTEKEIECDVENRTAETEDMEDINAYDSTIEDEYEMVSENEERKGDKSVRTHRSFNDKNVIMETSEEDEEVEQRNKKLKLCTDNEQWPGATPKPAIPGKNKTRGESVPRIKQIENVKYNIPPSMKPNRDNTNCPQPFSLRNYACSETSMSFSVDNDVESFKDMSMREGSICNFSECSNMSPPLDDADDAQSSIDFRGNVQQRTTQNYSQFDFKNLFGAGSSTRNMF